MISNQLKLRLGLLFLIINLILVFLLANRSHQQAGWVWMPVIAADESLPAGAFGDSKAPKNAAFYATHWKKVSTSEDGGYEVQTFREFKTYKSRSGRLLATIPLDHFQYLRYWIGTGAAAGGKGQTAGS